MLLISLKIDYLIIINYNNKLITQIIMKFINLLNHLKFQIQKKIKNKRYKFFKIIKVPFQAKESAQKVICTKDLLALVLSFINNQKESKTKD